MIWLTLAACDSLFESSEPEITRLEARPPASTDHVRVLYAHGAGMVGLGAADALVRHNLEMLEICAVESDLVAGTCARVRVKVELRRHGGMSAYVAEASPDVDRFSACLTRVLPDLHFPNTNVNIPGSSFDIALAIASPTNTLNACAERLSAARR